MQVKFSPFNTAFLGASRLWHFSFQLFFEICFVFLLELLHGGGHHRGPLYPSLLQWFGLNHIYFFVRKFICNAWMLTSFVLFVGKHPSCFTHPTSCFISCTLYDYCDFWNLIVLGRYIYFSNPMKPPRSRQLGLTVWRRKQLNGSQCVRFFSVATNYC